MKTAVIYRSKTGFTQKYAEWIAQELGADLFSLNKFDKQLLQSYDTIIYGGGLYAGGINSIRFIKGNLSLLKNKKVIVFGTGSSPWTETVVAKVRDKNFTPEEQILIKYFYLRGGLEMTKLGFFDRFLMKLLKMTIVSKKKKRELNANEKGMLAAMENPVDFSDKENIKELIVYARM